jgi:hypothetical protein
MIKHKKLLVSISIFYAQSFPCHVKLRGEVIALPLDQVKLFSNSFITVTIMKATKTSLNLELTFHLYDFWERPLAYEKNCFLLNFR